MQPMATADSAPEQATLTLSATAAGEASRVCHQVAAGETLWRIASQLQSKEAGGSDTYSYLLALVQENRDRMAKGIQVQAGQRLYCPKAQTLAQFDALSPAQRQQQFARLEQGRWGWREAWWSAFCLERSAAGSFLVSPPGPC
jgi:Tfp pilus assembly protein FimV